MRIKCYDMDGFIENLWGDDLEVHRRVVHVNRNRVPVGDSPRNPTSFEVYLQGSAAVVYNDGAQALVEYGEFCGLDRMTADGGMEGTTRADDLVRRLEVFCKERSLEIMPGVLDF